MLLWGLCGPATSLMLLSYSDKQLEIDCLTVDPKHFKKDIADKLIRYALTQAMTTASTALVNEA